MAFAEGIQKKYDEIAAMIIKFCENKLNNDFKNINLHLLEKLCRKRPSPLLNGRTNTWAAGIVYAIGQVNFIFDKSVEFYLTAGELAAYFDVSSGTAGNKAAQIRKMFKIDYFNNEWLLPDHVKNNPMNWMVTINGFIVDIRDMPPEMQYKAFEAGIIPYVPGVRVETIPEKIVSTNDIDKPVVNVTKNKRKNSKCQIEDGQSELPF